LGELIAGRGGRPIRRRRRAIGANLGYRDSRKQFFEEVIYMDGRTTKNELTPVDRVASILAPVVAFNGLLQILLELFEQLDA